MKCPPVILAILALPVIAHAVVSFEWATVGDAGNPNDSTGFGGVGYDYRIATKEVTIGQYTEFLNSTACKGDPHGLYNSAMALDTRIAGIQRTESDGCYIYSTMGNADRPITNVSWLDCARFVNWMHNGQGAGDTESGVYDMTLPASEIIRSGAATYFLPTENEWYKAAYYDPSAGGPADDYWLYPTRSDVAPENHEGTGPNLANFSDSSGTTRSGAEGNLTEVGLFSGSASFYGTYDQAGNVYEWNESPVGLTRGLRGGSWFNLEGVLRSSSRSGLGATFEGSLVGFRVASNVPEPEVAGLVLLGAMLLLRRKRG